MPLSIICHTTDAFNDEQREELAERVTNIVYPHLPLFYVDIVFQEVV